MTLDRPAVVALLHFLGDREDAREAAEGDTAQRRIDQVVRRGACCFVIEIDGLEGCDREASSFTDAQFHGPDISPAAWLAAPAFRNFG